MADMETHVTEAVPPKESQIKNEKEIVENNNNKKVLPKNNSSTNLFLYLCIIGVILGIVFEIFNIQTRRNIPNMQPKYWVLLNSERGDAILKHLHLVLERIGYERTTNDTPWDLLWSHPYPFTILKPHLQTLKPHQKVNHFPGTGFITNKVDFATTKSKYIPKAFRLPKDKEDFLKYTSENQKAAFVEKNNQHRGVVLKNVTDMDVKGDKFVQEYVPNPFLVDGYKFDIGVYVVVTSVDPLRVYYYNGDVLFRYCPEKYHPFDPKNVRKYVIEDDYRPTWEVPALTRLHTELGFGMKDAFDIYARSQGKNPARMWKEVNIAIMDIFTKKEKHIVDALKNYPSKNNFFELFRVDLMVDEDLNVYLLEANMSPNLSSPKQMNQLLYEQVLYSLFSVVGLGSPLRTYRSSFSLTDCGTTSTNEHYESCLKKKSGAAMVSAAKNIAVWGDECNSTCIGKCDGVCALCLRCLTLSDRDSLLQAYREHLHRGDFRRLFPPSMTQNATPRNLEDLSQKNRLMHLWYQGKCNVDIAWCT